MRGEKGRVMQGRERGERAREGSEWMKGREEREGERGESRERGEWVDEGERGERGRERGREGRRERRGEKERERGERERERERDSKLGLQVTEWKARSQSCCFVHGRSLFGACWAHTPPQMSMLLVQDLPGNWSKSAVQTAMSHWVQCCVFVMVFFSRELKSEWIQVSPSPLDVPNCSFSFGVANAALPGSGMQLVSYLWPMLKMWLTQQLDFMACMHSMVLLTELEKMLSLNRKINPWYPGQCLVTEELKKKPPQMNILIMQSTWEKTTCPVN